MLFVSAHIPDLADSTSEPDSEFREDSRQSNPVARAAYELAHFGLWAEMQNQDTPTVLLLKISQFTDFNGIWDLRRAIEHHEQAVYLDLWHSDDHSAVPPLHAANRCLCVHHLLAVAGNSDRRDGERIARTPLRWS
jgi:hypothetical protein